jgi:hypothetical protein
MTRYRTGAVPPLAPILVVLSLLLLAATTTASAQTNFSANLVDVRKVRVEISTPLNRALGEPVIHLFEVIKVGTINKTFERKTDNEVRRTSPEGHFVAEFEIPPPSDNFVRYEVEVRNYESAAGTEVFRGEVFLLKADIIEALSREIVVRFEGLNTTDWDKLRAWIMSAAAAGPDVTLVLPNGPTTTMKVTRAEPIGLPPLCPPPSARLSKCTLRVRLAIDKTLPAGRKGEVRLTFPPTVFAPNPIAEGLTLERIRSGVGTGQPGGTLLATGKDRDPIRTNVIEAGGSLNTSIKLDPDPATGKQPERETKGSADVRIAAPTIPFADSGRRFSTWTPVELDAQVSTGKLNGDSLSTNTMRLFTQLQRVYVRSPKEGPFDFFRLVGEAGAAADRDLRVIEYVASGDLRINPGFLNRVLDKDPPPDLGKRIKVEIMPIGFELGHRHVRRDPFFPADDFIRRLRFAAKMELELPPYLLFKMENRSWWRGEVNENRFKNYFTTSLTLTPANVNSSFGLFLSYDRGSLPPFTTQRISAFKVGIRFRRKQW